MKNCFVAIIIASALTISVVVIRQKAQAQNTQPTDKTGATVAKAVEAKTNNPPAPGSGAASQESSPIFLTEIPPDTATGG